MYSPVFSRWIRLKCFWACDRTWTKDAHFSGQQLPRTGRNSRQLVTIRLILSQNLLTCCTVLLPMISVTLDQSRPCFWIASQKDLCSSSVHICRGLGFG